MNSASEKNKLDLAPTKHGCFLKWAASGLLFVYFHPFQILILQIKLYALAGFELRFSELKSSTLTTHHQQSSHKARFFA